MTSQLLHNSFFKSIEYSLENSGARGYSKNSDNSKHCDTLKLSEISIVGGRSSTSIPLSKISYSEGQTIPSFVSWMFIFIGCALIALTLHFSQTSLIVYSNLLNIIFIIASMSCALALISKAEKTQVYRDTLSSTVLFQLKNDSHTKLENQKFITELNSAIKNTKDLESNKINLKTNAKLQYDIHNKNVDDLFNLGFIDELLYNRICSSMHEKVFGEAHTTSSSDNVIYLKQ